MFYVKFNYTFSTDLTNSLIFFPPKGHLERSGEKLVAKTVRRFGSRLGHHQAVLPRRWKRSEEELPGEVSGTAKSSICSESLHPDDGHADKNFRHLATQSR